MKTNININEVFYSFKSRIIKTETKSQYNLSLKSVMTIRRCYEAIYILVKCCSNMCLNNISNYITANKQYEPYSPQFTITLFTLFLLCCVHESVKWKVKTVICIFSLYERVLVVINMKILFLLSLESSYR